MSKKFIKSLFVSSTSLRGSMYQHEPKQNEINGDIEIVVISDRWSCELLRWRGHEIPAEIMKEICDLERSCGVSSGI